MLIKNLHESVHDYDNNLEKRRYVKKKLLKFAFASFFSFYR